MAEVQESLVGSGALPEVSASLPPYLKMLLHKSSNTQGGMVDIGRVGSV